MFFLATRCCNYMIFFCRCQIWVSSSDSDFNYASVFSFERIEGVQSKSLSTNLVWPVRGGQWSKYVFILFVGVIGNGSGTITSTPGNINCEFDCTDRFETGTVVTLAANPDIDSVFSGWDGACSGTGTCTVTMNAAKSVTASFVRRFIDLQDGTVVDPDSKLRWLKSADCLGRWKPGSFYSPHSSIESGDCGLTDGSVQGDWHLPSYTQYLTLWESGYTYNSLNATGFTGVKSGDRPNEFYGSSLIYVGSLKSSFPPIR